MIDTRRLVTWAVVSATVAGSVWLAATLPTPTIPFIAGHVACLSGRPVVGIWVQGDASGDSGWASWQATPGLPSYASFRHESPGGGTYSLSVGCGGTPKYWDVTATSPRARETNRDFICDDELGTSRYKTCY